MRYLGNKQRLTSFIENVIEKHNIQGEVFADIFAGTCSVGDYFKEKYTIKKSFFFLQFKKLALLLIK